MTSGTNDRKNLLVLGSTGSIGRNTLNVVENLGDAPFSRQAAEPHVLAWMAFDTQLKWVSTAALGTPVVPPVMI